MHQRHATRFLAAALLIAGTFAVGTSSTNADGPRPGLPSSPEAGGGWSHVVQGGAAEAKKAKQWARAPMQLTTVYTLTTTVDLPPGDPRSQRKKASNYLFLMAEATAKHPYGQTAPFTVRTAALGAVPVSATVRLAQRRESNGLPIPIQVTNYDDYYAPGTEPAGWPAGTAGRIYEDTHATEQVNVIVESLVVDGVDLGLRAGCQTKTLASLDLFGEGFISGDPAVDASKPWLTGHYAPGTGGQLTGTLDIPRFANCIARSGENISPLLSATVSGPGNRLTINVTDPFAGCTSAPLPALGQYNARAICPDKLPGDVSLPPTSH